MFRKRAIESYYSIPRVAARINNKNRGKRRRKMDQSEKNTSYLKARFVTSCIASIQLSRYRFLLFCSQPRLDIFSPSSSAVSIYSRPSNAKLKVNFATSRADCILHGRTLNRKRFLSLSLSLFLLGVDDWSMLINTHVINGKKRFGMM